MKLTIPKPPLISGPQSLTSLSKGLNLLLKLREASCPMSLTEISRVVGLHKVTTLRFLVTLERFQFVERDRRHKTYKIGRSAFYVGNGFFTEGKREKVLEIMKRVVRECGNTATLSVLDDTWSLFVERLDGVERVKVTIDIGSRVPAYSSASGRALLAGLTDLQIAERFKRVKFERSGNAPTSVRKLIGDVARVRARGYSVNDEESTPGILAIAVPVKNRAGEHVAALAMAFPAESLRTDRQKIVAEELSSAAEDMAALEIEDWRQVSRIGA